MKQATRPTPLARLARSARIAGTGALVLALTVAPPAVAPSLGQVPAGMPGPAPCPAMTLEGLTPAQESTARLALEVVCTYAASAEFARRIAAREWSPACPGFFFSRQRRIDAAAVLSAVRSEVPAFTLTVGTFSNRNVTAVTSVSARRITLVAARLDRLASGDEAARFAAGADLINTLGHEMTHLIPEPGDAAAFRFRDRGQSMPWCKRSLLVSYGVGQIYEDLWREGAAGR